MRALLNLSGLDDLGVVSPHYSNLQTSGGSGSRIGLSATGGGQPAGAGVGTPIAGNMTGSPTGQLRPGGTNVGGPTLKASMKGKAVQRTTYAASTQGARIRIGTGNLMKGGPEGERIPTTSLPGGLSGVHSASHTQDRAPQVGSYPLDALYGLGDLGFGFNDIGKGFSKTFKRIGSSFGHIGEAFYKPWVKVFTNPTKLQPLDIVGATGFGAPVASFIRHPRDVPYIAGTAAVVVGGGYLLSPGAAAGAGAPVAGAGAGGLPAAPGTLTLGVGAPSATLAAPGMAASSAFPAAGTYGAGSMGLLAAPSSTAGSVLAPIAGTPVVASAVPAGGAGFSSIYTPASVTLGTTHLAAAGGSGGGWLGTTILGASKAIGTAALVVGTNVLVAGAMARGQQAGENILMGGSPSPSGEAAAPVVLPIPVSSGGGGGGGSEESFFPRQMTDPWLIGAGLVLAALIIREVRK